MRRLAAAVSPGEAVPRPYERWVSHATRAARRAGSQTYPVPFSAFARMRCRADRASLHVIEADGEIGQRGRRERLFRRTLHNGRPAVTGWAGMDPGDAPVRIDHPEFANAVAGIQARLDFAVIAHA